MLTVNAKSQIRQININNLNIYYQTFGNGNIPIVILHGWGIDSDKYIETAEYILREAENCGLKAKIIIPDLPGFGKSDEPRRNWNLDDYVSFIDKFIETATRGRGFELIKNILKNINLSSFSSGGLSAKKEAETPLRFVLIGHSFGGRIAIKYAVKYPQKIEKLIMTGAAGIRHPLSIKKKMFFTLAKIGKMLFSLPGINILDKYAKILLYKATKEKDYNNASPRMKEVMKNVIGEDLRPILNQIKTPTLLLWGRDDRSTPLSDGNTMHDSIENSEMRIIDHANHSLPYQKPEEFAKSVLQFIKK